MTSLGLFQPIRRVWLDSVLSVQGLMQLLMIPRNGGAWTPQDRVALRVHLRQLGELAPLLAVFALPGGSLLLPWLAWFLDRRRGRRRANPAARD